MPSKEMRTQMDHFTNAAEELEKQGIKIRGYWTLGRYDVVSIIEAPTEKDVMKVLLTWAPVVDMETLTTVPRDEAIALL